MDPATLTAPAHAPPVLAPPPAAPGPPEVIDLDAAPPTTRIVLDRDLSPLDRLGDDERRRLLIRVLCGLVAYDSDPAARHLAD